jgi:hypothetical protein
MNDGMLLQVSIESKNCRREGCADERAVRLQIAFTRP